MAVGRCGHGDDGTGVTLPRCTPERGTGVCEHVLQASAPSVAMQGKRLRARRERCGDTGRRGRPDPVDRGVVLRDRGPPSIILGPVIAAGAGAPETTLVGRYVAPHAGLVSTARMMNGICAHRIREGRAWPGMRAVTEGSRFRSGHHPGPARLSNSRFRSPLRLRPKRVVALVRPLGHGCWEGR
jgi:hypothetical protein